MWKQGMGNPASGCRFSSELHGVWTYDHGSTEDGRKKYEESEEKGKLKKFFTEKNKEVIIQVRYI